MADEKELRELYWKLYVENVTQGRHHEAQRSTLATVMLTLSGVLIAFLGAQALSIWTLPIAVFLVLLGLFGAIFSAKQYERFRLHMERAAHFRNAIDKTFAGAIKATKRKADDAHEAKFGCLADLRLHEFWIGLFLVISVIGTILSVMILSRYEASG